MLFLQTKGPVGNGAFREYRTDLRDCDDVDRLAFCWAFFGEFHFAVDFGEQGVILAHANVAAGVKPSSALTNDNAACGDQFTAIGFYA